MAMKNGEAQKVVASLSFKSAYDLAKQVADMVDPNSTYKAALRRIRVHNKVFLWDKDIYKAAEHAVDHKSFVTIERIDLYR